MLHNITEVDLRMRRGAETDEDRVGTPQNYFAPLVNIQLTHLSTDPPQITANGSTDEKFIKSATEPLVLILLDTHPELFRPEVLAEYHRNK